MKRNSWSEVEVNDLGAEESDRLERKAGALFQDKNAFLNSLAKAASAFSNSGGGSLVLGVGDNGIPDGLPALVGRASMRDWIEQKLPNLLSYPLNEFRVHTVIPATPSRIPADRVVVVVDFYDSSLAPHQDTRSRIYYVRQGGRSEPASHFYLELLRQRLTNADLKFESKFLKPSQFAKWGDSIYAELALNFRIDNVGRSTAYKWEITPRTIIHDFYDNHQLDKMKIAFNRDNYPVKMPSSTHSVYLETAILPGCYFSHNILMGIAFLPAVRTRNALEAEIAAGLGELRMTFTLATETSPGEPVEIALQPLFDPAALAASAAEMLPDFFADT